MIEIFILKVMATGYTSPVMTLASLTTFILGSLKDENSGRVALYHYIKNFCRMDEALSPAVINRFYAECLQMNYWIEKKADLHADILDMLTRYFHVQRSAFSLEQIWDLSRLQLVPITQAENLFQIVKSHEQAGVKDGEILKTMPEGDLRVIALKKTVEGALEVRTYNNLTRVAGNQLVPLTHDQELFYNEVLELRPGAVQRLRLSPHTQMRFEMAPQNIIAQTVSGSAFRQSQLSQVKHFTEITTLFFHLKKLERFYIYRGSDPYYIELNSTLDKALELLKRGEQGSLTFGRKVFESAQIAFDQVFPDDKAVYLKLKELAKLLTVQKPINDEAGI